MTRDEESQKRCRGQEALQASFFSAQGADCSHGNIDIGSLFRRLCFIGFGGRPECGPGVAACDIGSSALGADIRVVGDRL